MIKLLRLGSLTPASELASEVGQISPYWRGTAVLPPPPEGLPAEPGFEPPPE
jgi:hypothetical protein